MTEDNAKSKLTLSGKSTLTLKNLGDKAHTHEGKKVVQVEVRKKRVINPNAQPAENNVKIDEATAMKLKLIAEAKEHEARRRQEEEEKERLRRQEREQEEKERLARQAAEEAKKAEMVKEIKSAQITAPVVEAEEKSFKTKDKKSKDYDDDEDEEENSSKKFRKASDLEKSREDVFEQERKKVMKRSFEPQRRGGKVNLHSIGSGDDDDDDYGFGGPRRRFKKKQPKPVQPVQPQEKVIKEVIIPDLEYAVEWLAVGTHATTTVPTKKAALGFLAKACLQTYEYGSTEYLQKALDSAKELIADCESGGAKYNAYMYPTYEEVFKESNNWENKEALWKHRWYAGSDGHGSSNGNYKLNRNDEYFLCNVNKFGAREDNQETRLTWEGCISGIFMPTQHLLNLYVQEDGTLDPRFHESFTTEWNANKNYIWDTSAANMYDKDESIVGTELKKGDLAIKFVMPQDEDYAEEKANRHTSNYLMIAYDDVYNDQKHNVNMQYNGMENQFRYFYPSLNKHNSSNYYVANASKKRNGNLNATFMMRMAEVYLIAAEADIYINGGANAMGYINKVRARAGAKALTGTATVRTVLDERGRELCGEYCRFYDLKRTGMFKSSNYLEETHPDLAQFFNPNYALRPISTTFTATISNGAEYQNPGY